MIGKFERTKKKKGIINLIAALLIAGSMSACTTINLNSLNSSKENSIPNNSIDNSILEDSSIADNQDIYDYKPFEGPFRTLYGSGYFSGPRGIYETDEQIEKFNTFFKDVKFVKSDEKLSIIPIFCSLSAHGSGLYYEVFEDGKVHFIDGTIGSIGFVSTTKIDYIECFNLLYAETYPDIRIGINA